MKRNLDIGLVRAFVEVARTGSMTRAGDLLGLTQGAISQKIKRLEDVLQVTLFRRGRRTLTLTRDGERLLGLSEPYLDANDEIWEAMTEPSIRGEVKLGIPHDLVAGYLPIALDGFVEANPNIDISLVTGTSPDLLEDVHGGKIDVAIVEQAMSATGGERLCAEPLVWIAGKGSATHRKRPLPLSMIGADCAFRAPVSEALSGAGIPWTYVFEHGTIEATMTVVRTGLALSVSLASAVPDDLLVLGAASGLPTLSPMAVNLHVMPGQASPAARELARHISEGVYQAQARSA